MEKIQLLSIEKNKNTIKYSFTVSEGFKKYFSGKDFFVEYPENIENVPDAIAAIPFVANVLPIIWLTDSKLLLPELDEDFYNSITDFKNGFIEMYPEVSFKGAVAVEKILKTESVKKEKYKSACLFSGGVDATTSALSHIEEKPLLVALWGSDVKVDNTEGWNVLCHELEKAANNYSLNLNVVRTSFREFDNESELNKQFSPILGKGYWYGIKHGIGIISHIAPLVWLFGIKDVYMASSNCPEDGTKVKCASDPRVDNRVRFNGCQVYHDGFELNRQKKIQFITQYKRKHPGTVICLHVCWESGTGQNCCHCEKCYRTMAELWIEGEDPKDYGFDYAEDVFKTMYKKVALEGCDTAKNTWTYGKNRLIENWDVIKHKKYAKKIKWIKTFDFHHLDKNKNRFFYTKKIALKRMLKRILKRHK